MTWLRRDRLVDLVSEASRRPLTVINAPAGYGKSIAVTDFVQSSGFPAAWVSLDRDDDAARFWRKARVGLGGTDLSPDLAPDLPADGRFLPALLEDLARIDDTTFLVLDDLHELRDRQVLQQLAFLVNRLPPQMRILATTRQSPALPIGRWRAQGHLAEIGQDELRFWRHEAAELFDHLGVGDIGPEQLDALIERAEGWPAGLQLLAASLPTRADVRLMPIDAVAARSLVDGLLADITPQLQDFVLETSVLRRFGADVCRAVTGREDAGQLLRAVEEANLFLVPLDEARLWFRYRRLFAELMTWELENRKPGRAAELRHRAGRWFEAQGDAREALGHLVGAGRIDEAFMLANEDAYRPWREDSFLGTDWSEVFSIRWIEDDPARMIHFATLLGRSGWLDQAQSWIERAATALQSWPAEDPRHGLLLGVRALWHGIHLDARPTLALGERAIALLGEDDPGALLLRQRMLVAFVNAHFVLDDLDAAEADCDQLDALATSEVMHDLVVPAMRSRIALRRGLLRQAEGLGRRVLRTAEMMGLVNHPSIRDADIAVGLVHAEREEWNQAETHLRAAVGLGEVQGWRVIAAAAGLLVARVRAERLGPDAGLAEVEEVRRSLVGAYVGPELATMFASLEAGMYLEKADHDRAGASIDALPAGNERTLLAVRLDLARDQAGSAAARLAAVEPQRLRDRIVKELLAARIALALGQDDESDEHLLAAARLGQPEGYRHVYFAETPDLVRRLHDVARPQPELASLVDALAATLVPAPGEGHGELTERERAVLRFLATRLSNQEIATQLEISANTLKTHIRLTYRKLGVGSRAEAVEVARRAGLL